MTAKVERERAGAVERSKILRFSPLKPSCMAAFYRRWWSDRVAVGRRRGVWRACDGGWSAGVGGRRRVVGKGDGDGMACAALRRASCTLVLQFMIVSIASLIGLKFSMLLQLYPWPNFKFSL